MYHILTIQSFLFFSPNDSSSSSWLWMQCAHLASVIFLSTSTLYDTDVGWLLNTLLCMFYECDDYSNSTSEPVVCQWSQRMYSLPRLYLSVTLRESQTFKNWLIFLFSSNAIMLTQGRRRFCFTSEIYKLTIWVFIYRDDFTSLIIIIGDHNLLFIFFNLFSEHYQHIFFFTWNVIFCEIIHIPLHQMLSYSIHHVMIILIKIHKAHVI